MCLNVMVSLSANAGDANSRASRTTQREMAFMKTSRWSARRRQLHDRTPQQPRRNGDVDEIPCDSVEERRTIRAGRVEDHARHPAAERHAEQRGGDHGADACSDFRAVEELTDDDCVRWHDAALEQPEQGRDHVERYQPVE